MNKIDSILIFADEETKDQRELTHYSHLLFKSKGRLNAIENFGAELEKTDWKDVFQPLVRNLVVRCAGLPE